MNKIEIDKELLRREFEKKVKTLAGTVIITCDICADSLWNDDRRRQLRGLGLPNEKFCGMMNEEMIRYVYVQLLKRKLEG